MDKTTKISDKCLKCGHELDEDEDVYCQTCIDADEKPEEEQPQDEEKGVDPEKEPAKPQAFIEIHIDEKRGPICILNQELGVTPQLVVMAIAGFGMMFVMPIINGSSQAIWQSKVDADLQGRVFSVRRMIAWSMTPIAYALAGPLNDQVFKPLLVEGGALADSIVGQLIGVGPGRGTGLLFILLGFLSVLAAASGYLNPRVRNVETELPDAELKTVEDAQVGLADREAEPQPPTTAEAYPSIAD